MGESTVTLPVAEPHKDGWVTHNVGVAAIALTVAIVVPAALVQLLTVTVTEYVPVAAVVALVMDGVLEEEIKLLGPVQL
jgi:hypothetical protein